MSDKSSHSHTSKKSAKSLKDKRAEKRADASAKQTTDVVAAATKR